MRKYQQLALLIISALSVIILILYKNENNRLKDVLQVVNIFGRSDEAILRRLENLTKTDEIPQMGPMPVWQALSENFHAYGAYWNRNELMAGGEVIALVVGKKDVVVNFGCALLYDGGARSIRGKLQFQRADNTNDDYNSEFTLYNFFCRIQRDFGTPENVIFNDITNSKHITPEIRIRHIKPSMPPNLPKSLLNVCVDLVTPNRTSKFIKDDSNWMQFFLHHQSLGVQDFLIYNSDQMPMHVQSLLRRFNIRLYMIPFNFPFSTANHTERVRRIMETDCLIRNTNIASFALLLMPNEFFYPGTKLDSTGSVLRSIHQYAGEIDRFELPTYSVCVTGKHKLLFDNTLYDPEVRSIQKVFIYRTHIPITTGTPQRKDDAILPKPSVSLSLSIEAIAHRYSDCTTVGKDGLHEWRNSIRQDFMNYLQELRNELDIII